MCPLGIPAAEIRYTVVLLVTGQVLQTVLLSPPLSRATIWENCKEPVDGSNICEIKNSWGGANLYIQWRLNESSAFSEKYRGWIPPPTHMCTHIPLRLAKLIVLIKHQERLNTLERPPWLPHAFWQVVLMNIKCLSLLYVWLCPSLHWYLAVCICPYCLVYCSVRVGWARVEDQHRKQVTS